MKQTIYAPNTVPTANVAVNKSRLKVYKNTGNLPTYYLQKGTEFQIEITNPTTDVVLAKVILNGKPISQGGLVLNPGQRVFLERYLDVPKKFLFDTYEVSGSDEMKQAIANNGDIKVEFYKEEIPYYNPITYVTNGFYGNNNLYNSGTPSHFLKSGVSSGVASYSSGSLNNTSTSYNSSNASFTNSCIAGSATMDFLNQDVLNDRTGEINLKTLRKRSVSSTKSIETGRVEKGTDSNQQFRTVNKTFSMYAFHTVEYKLLPISQKLNTISDINVKIYCTNCGSKLGKTDKFCSSCGTKK